MSLFCTSKRDTESSACMTPCIHVKFSAGQLYALSSQYAICLQCLACVQPMGVKSKRFMKLMLQNMKSFRYIKTVKTGKGTQMGYILPENMNPKGKGVPWPMPPMDPSAQQQQAQQEAA